MAVPIVHGNADPIEQPSLLDFRSDGTYRQTRRFEGVPAGMLARFNAENVPGQDVTLDQGWLVSRMEISVEIGTGELETGVLEIKWELDRLRLRRALRKHTNPVTGILTFDSGYVPRLDELLRKGEDPAFDTDPLLAGINGITEEYYYLRLAGTEAYFYTAYVLRRTDRVNNSAEIEVSHDGANTVVPIPEDVPTQFFGGFPANIEWFKQTPDIRKGGNNNWELVQEYWGGTPLWSEALYGGTFVAHPDGSIPQP